MKYFSVLCLFCVGLSVFSFGLVLVVWLNKVREHGACFLVKILQIFLQCSPTYFLSVSRARVLCDASAARPGWRDTGPAPGGLRAARTCSSEGRYACLGKACLSCLLSLLCSSFFFFLNKLENYLFSTFDKELCEGLIEAYRGLPIALSALLLFHALFHLLYVSLSTHWAPARQRALVLVRLRI